MIENPYAAPAAAVGDVAAPKIPEDVLKKIRYAWITAAITGAFTLALSLLAISGKSILGYSALESVDAALIFGLAFGIYKKSRVCSVLMLVYFVVSKILIMVEAGQPQGLVLSLIFGFFYYHGAVGTFEYHRIVRKGVSPSGRA
ncbi:hypothetical protein [Lysobacter niastensis]|uniref:Uncharacterized protein n=1 Tax=Lysobacter niastensis TaxID=380629 RepID=A0ABS0B4N4_9GAMM|nr:hypothetical protein [Lysobacter niastensis]MBF6023432.1 hypothetical protein [Lysobacter niastensis]